MQAVSETLGYLQALAPELMRDVRVTVQPVPPHDQHHDGIDRWHIQRPDTVVLFRVPIERFAHMSLSNPAEQIRYREYIERTVVAAVSELLDGRLDDILPPDDFDR